MHKWEVWIWFYNPNLAFRKLSTSWICSIIFSINIIITLSFSFCQFSLFVLFSWLSSIDPKRCLSLWKSHQGSGTSRGLRIWGLLRLYKKTLFRKESKMMELHRKTKTTYISSILLFFYREFHSSYNESWSNTPLFFLPYSSFLLSIRPFLPSEPHTC